MDFGGPFIVYALGLVFVAQFVVAVFGLFLYALHLLVDFVVKPDFSWPVFVVLAVLSVRHFYRLVQMIHT